MAEPEAAIVLSETSHEDAIREAQRQWQEHGWDAGPHFLAALATLRVEELIRRSNSVALEPHGLTHTRHEALALLYLSRNGEMPMGKLSQKLMVHVTSITSTVDSLERLGLVTRAAHPTDRRTTLARITPRGRKVMEQTSLQMAASSFGVGALTDREATQLFRLLNKVRASAGDIVDAGPS
jgi:DNA-binding MarR family transcriptional regulator